MIIEQSETQIKGSWTFVNGKICMDSNASRIEELIHKHLKKLATDDTGWDTLYIDPNDNRLWELLYLDSENYGGGPPTLKQISRDDALLKYHCIHDF